MIIIILSNNDNDKRINNYNKRLSLDGQSEAEYLDLHRKGTYQLIIHDNDSEKKYGQTLKWSGISFLILSLLYGATGN